MIYDGFVRYLAMRVSSGSSDDSASVKMHDLCSTN